MSQKFWIGICYVLIALAIEEGALSQIGVTKGYVHWGDMRLVALGVILAGVLRGPFASVTFGLLAAIPAGAIMGPGNIGCTWLSFTLTAYLGTWVVRWFYLEYFSIRFAVLFGLIVFESWIWSVTRHFYWPQTPVEVQWPTHLVVALIGSLLYWPASAVFRFRRGPLVPIGRRKIT